MLQKKKERLYITDIIDDPAITFPMYYTLSTAMRKNEILHDALRSIHTYDFSYYKRPDSYEDIFTCVDSGAFAIYKEQYAVGYFGGRLMYLESGGWKSFYLVKEAFDMGNWLV